MRQSGAKLVEVGTTNCTYAADYENAITSGTAALLRVHRSNFRVSGFTHDIELEELTDIAARHNLILIDDLGSGCFLDVTQFGLAPEPLVQKSIALGAITCFSGDKLVGGPQAGIIAGKKMCIDKIKKHPLARALRFDKVRTAGMEVTLGHYLKNEALQKIPVWRIISTPIDDIQRRAAAWAESLGCIACVIEGETMIGGGSMPGASIPTKLLAIGSKGNVPSQKFVQDLVKKLRAYSPAIIGRVDDNVLLLDPRTVLPEEDETVLKALRMLCLS
jgi:L-seryl-tRNA(Ser) seleniumtransferase